MIHRRLQPTDGTLLSVDRRQTLRALALACTAALAPVLVRADATAKLPVPRSLAESLDAALRSGQPLVVMVSLDGCAFCKVARAHYLAPMQQREGLPVVQLNMRTSTPVLDFQGASTTHDALVRQWGVRVAPTVLFFGAGGVEVAERLRGASIPDYYGAYLDQRLSVARAVVQR